MTTDTDFLNAGATIAFGNLIFEGKNVGHYHHGNFILSDEGVAAGEQLAKRKPAEEKKPVTRKKAPVEVPEAPAPQVEVPSDKA